VLLYIVGSDLFLWASYKTKSVFGRDLRSPKRLFFRASQRSWKFSPFEDVKTKAEPVLHLLFSQPASAKGFSKFHNQRTTPRALLSMGAIRWGTRGTCPPHFCRRGDIICYVPPTFYSLGFVFGEVAKIKVTNVTFHVRCIAKPSGRWNRVSCDTTDSDIFISFRFDKMIFSILQVSWGRERLLTASVRHFTLCGIRDFFSNHWLYRPTIRQVIFLKQ